MVEAWIFAFLGIIVIMIGVSAAMESRRSRQWEELASALGFQSPPRKRFWIGPEAPLTGKAGPFPAQVRVYETGSGKHKQRWTALEVVAPGGDPGFLMRVTREGLGARIAKAVGGQDVQLGNAEFDAQFRVRGSDEPRVRRALELGVQLALPELLPFEELSVEPAMSFEGMGWAPSGGGGPLKVLRGPLMHLPEVQAALDQASGGEAPMVRYVRRGFVVDPEVYARALPVLARIAESLAPER